MTNPQSIFPSPPQQSNTNTFYSWRTEPPIPAERQKFLSRCLEIQPDIERGIYPFKGVPLTRADIEWLLINHEGGRGPIDWNDISQRERMGLDLRGADLRHVNLRNLPLARIRGGLTQEEWLFTNLEQRNMAGVHLEGADCCETRMEGTLLRGAFLNEATLRNAHLQETVLFSAYLQHAYLRNAHLEAANLYMAHLEGAYLRKAFLAGADLGNTFFDSTTNLEQVILRDSKWGCVLLVDAHWSEVNLSVIDWTQVKMLGDEHKARNWQPSGETSVEKRRQLEAYRKAVRANRQLANAMRAQGMNEEAVPFAYRAQVLQRSVLWRVLLWGEASAPPSDMLHAGFSQRLHNGWLRTRNGASLLFSWLLDILAGYGYKPGRSVLIYLLMIVGFATCYFLSGRLSIEESIIFSVTSFHGRGFLPGPFTLGSPVTALAALEAVVGLFIEISFIATFTQRFFGK